MGNDLRRLPLDVYDFWDDEMVAEMTIKEAGFYLWTLSYQWKHGSIPADFQKLKSKIHREGRAFEKAWKETLSIHFPPLEGNPERLANKRLLKMRAEVEGQISSHVERGRKGGEKTQKRRRENQAQLEAQLEAQIKHSSSKAAQALNRTELNRKEPGLEKETSPAPASLDLLNLIAGTEVSPAWKEYISEIVAIVEKHSEGPMEVESIVDAIRNGSINELDRFTVSSLLRFANSKKIKVPESPGKTDPKHKSDPDIYRERSPSINLTGTIDEMMGKLKEALPGWTWKRWRAAEALASREDAMLQGKYVKG